MRRRKASFKRSDVLQKVPKIIVSEDMVSGVADDPQAQ